VVDALSARLDADPDLLVDIVMDDDRCARGSDGKLSCELSRLEGRDRVTIVDDARSRYMHHKFAVIDGTYLWTGSGNLTSRSLCSDFNDAIVVDRAEIVAAYEAEFDRMFTGREFGPRPPMPPYAGGPYTVYFGPESPIAEPPSWHDEILSAIEGATVSIDLLVFAWTHTDIADALIAAYGRGVLIRGVVAPSYANDPPALAAVAAGIPIRTASVHSKVLILDGARVVTGTPNWSQNAWANDEASLWIDGAPLAAAYTDRFDEIWAISLPP
jgi:phosphatidylserine/phosphatidylglycerophosphate/cardiolipin synthase-like enzyme